LTPSLRKIGRPPPTYSGTATGKKEKMRAQAAFKYLEQPENKLKLSVIMNSSRHDMGKMMTLIKFARLPIETLQVICSWTDSDWLNYGGIIEEEYYFNRKPEDIPESKRKDDYSEDDRSLVSLKMFKQLNKRKGFNYIMYRFLRTEELRDE
jgi:hypothetical protein